MLPITLKRDAVFRVKLARTIAKANLDDAVSYETKHVLEFLLSQDKVIYPKAILTYNKWVAE